METKKLIFSIDYKIRWQDMDAFNHVNHTIYFIYMQECRIEWLKSHGINMDSASMGPIVGEISCRYLRPITYPAEITVELLFSHKSGRRIYFEHQIRNKSNPELVYAIAQVTVVWIDFKTGKSIPEPEEYKYLLNK